jgi:hypothetical protein
LVNPPDLRGVARLTIQERLSGARRDIKKIADLSIQHLDQALATKGMKLLVGCYGLDVTINGKEFTVSSQMLSCIQGRMGIVQGMVEQIQNACMFIDEHVSRLMEGPSTISVANTWMGKKPEHGMAGGSALDEAQMFQKVDACLVSARAQLQTIEKTVTSIQHALPASGDMDLPAVLAGVQTINTYARAVLDNVGPRVVTAYLEPVMVYMRQVSRDRAEAEPPFKKARTGAGPP